MYGLHRLKELLLSGVGIILHYGVADAFFGIPVVFPLSLGVMLNSRVIFYFDDCIAEVWCFCGDFYLSGVGRLVIGEGV